ncbi:MAG: cysteine desulfurase CsdA [Verrucomicrobiales bacterium VVV1]|nr:MAG: cysteine desulfurase CsdA [Verrucomicrobiales bacterium VVV1]
MLDADLLRRDFPILHQQVNGKPLVYLDNAATTQKPLAVLEASRRYYEEVNANIHRGAHTLARLATESYEAARQTVAKHLHADSPDEVIFTSGCTDSINLVAISLGRSGLIKQGDIILISTLEHHANIVPWQMLCELTGATLEIIPCHEDGSLDQEAYSVLLEKKPKLVAFNWISNAFGTVNPVIDMTAKAKAAGALVLIDAAQAMPHLPIDVQTLGADFLAFSGHKVYAPTGIGVLWGKREILESIPPYRGGGEMIKEVTFAKTTYNDLPFKFEAGTPNIEGTIALGTALDYVNAIGIEAIHAHETGLMRAAEQALSAIPGMHFYGPSDRAGALSFSIKGIHHYDLGTLLDQMGIAVRTGHHCCQPLMARFGMTGTTRASFALYNTMAEVEALAAAVGKAARMLG